MTTETTTATVTANKVIVVGMLDTMLVQDRNARRDKEGGRRKLVEVTKKQGRDREKGGRWRVGTADETNLGGRNVKIHKTPKLLPAICA